MNFDISEEQTMLKDSVARFVQDQYDFQTRRQIVASDTAYSADHWRTFAELGWLSVPFKEEHGGFGGNVIDTMVVMEEFGKGLVAEPYLATVLLFGGLLNHGANAAQCEAFIPGIIAGEVQGAFAYLEAQSRFELTDIKTSASVEGDGYVINGEKTVVFNGSNADALVVSTRTAGEQFDEAGISLFVVDANAAGVSRSAHRLMDGQLVANIRFDNVSVAAEALLGTAGEGFALMQLVIGEATVALCAEALGAMEKLNATTLEYTKTRQQFGVHIGSFQALQHRMVDTFMAYEQTKSMLFRTVCAITAGEDDSALNIHALKVMVDRSSTAVAGEAIQMHGGMGMTDELDVGHYMKRLLMINATFGNGDYHQQKFNALKYG